MSPPGQSRQRRPSTSRSPMRARRGCDGGDSHAGFGAIRRSEWDGGLSGDDLVETARVSSRRARGRRRRRSCRPVIAVMSAVEIEPTDAHRRPGCGRARSSLGGAVGEAHVTAEEAPHRDRRELRRSGCVHTIALTVFAASSFTGALPVEDWPAPDGTQPASSRSSLAPSERASAAIEPRDRTRSASPISTAAAAGQRGTSLSPRHRLSLRRFDVRTYPRRRARRQCRRSTRPTAELVIDPREVFWRLPRAVPGVALEAASNPRPNGSKPTSHRDSSIRPPGL